MSRSIYSPLYSLASPLLDPQQFRHGFYGRIGGVSSGEFASLNCSPYCGDNADCVAANRKRVADDLGAQPFILFTNKQVHGNKTRIITANDNTTNDNNNENFGDPEKIVEADGIATNLRGIALGILTADCAPVLFADPQAAVIGAAHAGWRGALGGISDSVIAAMCELGADVKRIICVIGPAIQCNSYQVGGEFVAQFRDTSPLDCAGCFREIGGANYFDLAGYVKLRVAHRGVEIIEQMPHDTLGEAEQFFSYRRNRLAGKDDCGRQMSVIGLIK